MYTDSLQFIVFYDFLTLWWCESDTFVRNHTSNFESWSLPGLAICSILLSGDAGQWQRATAPCLPLQDDPLKSFIPISHSAFNFVHFSHSVMSDSLQPHGLQHARLPCPLPTPRVCSNTCPLSRWCHPMISSSVIPFSSCLESLPASGSSLMSQFFASDGEVSASASVLSMNIQDWFPLGWTSWISLQSKALSRVFSNTTVQKHQFFSAQLSL